MSTDNDSTTELHSAEFLKCQKRVLTTAGKIKGLNGPAAATVYKQYHGVLLTDLLPDERSEFDYRLVQINSIMRSHNIQTEADYRRIPTRDAARILAHAVTAVDW